MLSSSNTARAPSSRLKEFRVRIGSGCKCYTHSRGLDHAAGAAQCRLACEPRQRVDGTATPSTTLSSTTPRFDRSRGDPEALSALRRLPLSLPTLGESVRSCSTGWLHDQRRWRCWPQNLGMHHATARASVTLQTHLPKVRPACSSRRWKPRGGRLRTIFFASAPIPVLPPLPPTHSSPPRPLSAYRSRQHTAFPPALHPSSALPILSLTFPPPTSHPHVYVANPFPPQIFCGRAQWTKIATLVANANAGFEMHNTRNCSGGGVGMHTKTILGTLLPLPMPAPKSDPEATESDTESGPEPESSSDVEIIDSKVDEEERGQLHAWLAWGTLSESGFQPVLTLGVVMRLDTEQAMEGAVTWERPAKRYGRGDVPWPWSCGDRKHLRNTQPLNKTGGHMQLLTA
ncbi:hypothetical protein K438DRAFT_1938345 [Mycena galopus ATCC 62051]|nr:hypothetical protein K438DRAFT_1938345 [Mycena galopus ATCC 62051]